MNFVFDKLTYNLDSLSLENFTLSVGSKKLFIDSSLVLSSGNVYGLIGKNGSGKTSLLKQLALNNILSENKIKVLYVEQELDFQDKTPIDFIFGANSKLNIIKEKLDFVKEQLDKDESNEELLEQLCSLEDEYTIYNIDKEYSVIKKILNGLGFTDDSMTQSCNIFSGGWKMRISLARALYLEPDLLLLDEPTNHLDLGATIWLGDYLDGWKKTAIVVSHNIGFLNEVCSYILNIENSKLSSYKGNYYKFKDALSQKRVEQEKAYNTFEKKLKEFKKKNQNKTALDDFIKKHQVIRPEPEYNVKINFAEVPVLKSQIIKVDNVSFGYTDDKPILKNISFGLDMTSRVVLVGANGTGKSTIMKLIVNDIEPDEGEIWIHNNLRIGYYNQHFEEQLPMEQTPIEYLLSIVPDTFDNKIATIRSYLGYVKLEGTAHTKLIKELSGGQKARVALVKLVFQQPHMLILDEPTNHLDIETVEALIEGLKKFNGGIMLITHEPELINALESELWILNQETKTIDFYKESYEDYCEMILGE
jgi:ATP-binding cassette subfamily F protein 1